MHPHVVRQIHVERYWLCVSRFTRTRPVVTRVVHDGERPKPLRKELWRASMLDFYVLGAQTYLISQFERDKAPMSISILLLPLLRRLQMFLCIHKGRFQVLCKAVSSRYFTLSA